MREMKGERTKEVEDNHKAYRGSIFLVTFLKTNHLVRTFGDQCIVLCNIPYRGEIFHKIRFGISRRSEKQLDNNPKKPVLSILNPFFREFGIPAPDVMYDLKKLISPDFAMFTRHGKIAEFDLRLSNQVKGIKFERELIHERMQQQKSPESKFGGAI